MIQSLNNNRNKFLIFLAFVFIFAMLFRRPNRSAKKSNWSMLTKYWKLLTKPSTVYTILDIKVCLGVFGRKQIKIQNTGKV